MIEAPPADWPKMGHVVGVASEGGDVLFDPIEGSDLIGEVEVPGDDIVVQAQKPEDVEPVVDCHLDDVGAADQAGAVKRRVAPSTGDLSSAMNPEHDGLESILIRDRTWRQRKSGGEDVEIQTVLAVAPGVQSV